MLLDYIRHQVWLSARIWNLQDVLSLQLPIKDDASNSASEIGKDASSTNTKITTWPYIDGVRTREWSVDTQWVDRRIPYVTGTNAGAALWHPGLWSFVAGRAPPVCIHYPAGRDKNTNKCSGTQSPDGGLARGLGS